MNLFCCVLFGLFLLAPGLTGQQLSAAPATENLARMHWLGLQQISLDTNSAQVMSVWRLPQTAALVAQALDKFSRWPGQGATNAASALLRPLLDDLVSSETYLEIRAPTSSQPRVASNPASGGEGGSAPDHQLPTLNSQLALVLALRLPADRARLWQTNLAAALEALTGLRSVPVRNGWLLREHEAPDLIEFSRVGEWTLVGLGQKTNDLLTEFVARIARDPAPFARSATNFWLEADLNPSRLFPRLSTLNLPVLHSASATEDQLVGAAKRSRDGSTLNRLRFTALGESGVILTRGTFNFSHPLDLPLLPWKIPTNLIHEPLTSFTVARGLAPWLVTTPVWQKLEFTPPPDQACSWTPWGDPFQTYFIVPLPAASNQLRQLAGRLVQNANPWLATNGEGFFQWSTNLSGIVWNGAFIALPQIKPIIVNQQEYVLAGLVPFVNANSNPEPVEIRQAVLSTTNLVYYQFEQTDRRIEDGLFITQLLRLLLHKSQLPAGGALWLKNLEPMLGDSTTFVAQTGTKQLTFDRKSTIGFTAFELHLIADWLESPQFPYGLHTFSTPP